MTEAKRTISIVLLAMVLLGALSFTSFVAPPKAQAINALGIPFGGRITATVLTGYVWGVPPVLIYCPPHIWVFSFGAYKGPMAIFIPPASPRAFYNFFTPGNAIEGGFYPVPNLALCPFYPVYYSSLAGTSAIP